MGHYTQAIQGGEAALARLDALYKNESNAL